MSEIRKIVKKSEVWSKHGKHKGGLQAVLTLQRQKKAKLQSKMYPSVRAALAAESKRRKL